MNKESPIILVIDDDPSVCSSLKRLLRTADYQVQIFKSTDGVFSLGRPARPCCVILDVEFPNENGLDFQQNLIASGVQVPVIFISGHGNIPMSVKAIKSGAVDFLPKPFNAAKLLDAVARAVELDLISLQQNKTITNLRERYKNLTRREAEVFAAVTSGLLNKQAADELGIAEKTIKVHRARAMEKMGAESVADLVRMADILGIHWENVCGADNKEQIPRTGISSHQKHLASLAASRARKSYSHGSSQAT